MSIAAVAAAGDDIQHSLNDKYKGQTLALRHPLKASDQHYDSAGKVLSPDFEGPWTVFGRVKIEEIKVGSTKLRIKATRFQYEFDKASQKLVPARTQDHVIVEIALSKPLSSENEADSILAGVFALSDKDVLEAAPPFWRGYLSKHMASAATNSEPQQTSSAKETTSPVSDGKIHRVGEKSVTAPKALYTPEPEFTDFARKASYQGTLMLSIVVGPDGLPRNVSIVLPLGMGLDENAVDTVRTWRFQPATMNGEPVAVAMQVEVSFNLYRRK